MFAQLISVAKCTLYIYTDLGAILNDVAHLLQKVPKCVNHIVHFDNLYMSLLLLLYLSVIFIHLQLLEPAEFLSVNSHQIRMRL